MKEFSKQQVDDMIKLRFGRLVTSPDHTAYATCKVLGKIFGVSGSQIHRLCRMRFEDEAFK